MDGYVYPDIGTSGFDKLGKRKRHKNSKKSKQTHIFPTTMSRRVFQSDSHFVLALFISYYFVRFTGSRCSPTTAALLSQRRLLENGLKSGLNSSKTDALLKNPVLARMNNCGVAVNAAASWLVTVFVPNSTPVACAAPCQ